MSSLSFVANQNVASTFMNKISISTFDTDTLRKFSVCIWMLAKKLRFLAERQIPGAKVFGSSLSVGGKEASKIIVKLLSYSTNFDNGIARTSHRKSGLLFCLLLDIFACRFFSIVQKHGQSSVTSKPKVHFL